jgi:hypothetical protein
VARASRILIGLATCFAPRAVLVHGFKIRGKFGSINGQVTFNGWPLYLYTGEKQRQNHANGSFKVIAVRTR